MSKMFQNVFQVEKGLVWIATGMNHHIVDEITVKDAQMYEKIPLKTKYAESFTEIEMNKQRWWQAAENEMSLCDWLEKHVHHDR